MTTSQLILIVLAVVVIVLLIDGAMYRARELTE